MKLEINEIKEKLNSIDKNWSYRDNSLKRNFVFKNFIDAFSFMTKVAILSENVNHHPNWSNVYNKVEINLSTHDIGGVSNKDFQLAKEIDNLL